MFKMFIKWDKEKIIRDDRYNLSDLEQIVLDVCQKSGISKDNEGYYVCHNFGKIGGIIIGLSKKSWFMENVKDWRWYNVSGPDEIHMEDIKAQLDARGDRSYHEGMQSNLQ